MESIKELQKLPLDVVIPLLNMFQWSTCYCPVPPTEASTFNPGVDAILEKACTGEHADAAKAWCVLVDGKNKPSEMVYGWMYMIATRMEKFIPDTDTDSYMAIVDKYKAIIQDSFAEIDAPPKGPEDGPVNKPPVIVATAGAAVAGGGPLLTLLSLPQALAAAVAT